MAITAGRFPWDLGSGSAPQHPKSRWSRWSSEVLGFQLVVFQGKIRGFGLPKRNSDFDLAFLFHRLPGGSDFGGCQIDDLSGSICAPRGASLEGELVDQNCGRPKAFFVVQVQVATARKLKPCGSLANGAYVDLHRTI